MQGYAWLYHKVMGSKRPKWGFRFFHKIEDAIDDISRNVTEDMCLWELGAFQRQDQMEGITRDYGRDSELWKLFWTPLYPHHSDPSNKSTPLVAILPPVA